ncbi:multidrug effflux MFS transporter [Nesterenkonia suensis]
MQETSPQSALTAGDRFTTGQRIRLILVLGVLIALGPLTVDMYLPAFPAIRDDLMTTEAAVQLTLTGTLAGLAVGQLLIGPLSDAVGRRRPLLVGVGVHVLASVGCVLAPDLAILGGMRVLQGLGAAAAAVVAMAVVRDLFVGMAAAKLLSRLMLVMGAAPVLAPTLGGLMLALVSWRGVFVMLAVFGVAILVIAAVLLPETLPEQRRRRGGPLGTLRDCRRLLRDRPYVGLILVAGLAMASLFAYVSGSSFVFQQVYGLDEQQYGVVFGLGAVGLIIATQCNVRLLRRFSPAQIMTGALVGGTLSGLALLFVAVTGLGGLGGLLVPLWLVLAACGLALPNAPALALSRHGETAGTAAALLGAVQFGVAAAAAPLVGVLGTGETSMAIVIAAGMAAAMLVALLVVRPTGIEAGTSGAVSTVP